ncbi:MAG: MerR family transcriptional regulator, partial [Eubacterium sp.]|nr:MerR family transcriptional regulator [Eubacterium sp.]
MKYKVSDLAKLFGVTSNTIRRYSKMGLLSPEINDSNYRFFSEEDVHKTAVIRLFLKCGFSLDEITEMYNKSYDDIIDIYTKQLNEMDKQLERIKFLRHWLKDNIQNIKTAKELESTYKIRDCLEMKYVLYSEGSQLYNDKERLNIINRFMYTVPEVYLCQIYKSEDFKKGEILPRGCWAIKTSDIKRFSLNEADFESSFIEDYPKKRSLIGILEISAEEKLTTSEQLELRKNYIKKTLKYIEENNYTPNGDIIEIVISSLDSVYIRLTSAKKCDKV